ncbi:MAG: dienelactone hydrolase family protein [Acidimicrobiales bacterium]
MALDDYLAQEIALDWADGHLSRREALRRLLLLGLSATGAATVLAACSSSGGDGGTAATGGAATTAGTAPASAATGSTGTTDPAAGAAPSASTTGAGAAEQITFPGPEGDLFGVLATAAEPKGAVLVIHENRGLTPHIASIPPRLAADGYTALAIDLLSAEGGTASLGGDGEATAALGRAPAERMIADLRAGLDELGRRAPGAELGAMGFCFGGGMTWQLLAAGEPRLAAAVPFYGPCPADASFAGSPRAAVLAVYAGLDDRVNASQGAARAALEAAGLTYEVEVFEGVDHAFFNDTGPRYDAEAASQAYDALLNWLGQHLAA